MAGVVLFLLSLSSCKKNVDRDPPVIEIHHPMYGASFSPGDTIHVLAQVTDDQMVRSVSVNVTTLDFRPVTPVKTFHPQTTHYELVTTLVPDNSNIETGEHYLRIIATDGTLEKRAYLKIWLEGSERRIMKYLATTDKGPSRTGFRIYSPNLLIDTSFTISRSHLLTLTNSGFGQYLFVTPNPSHIIAVEAIDNEIAWETQVAPPYAEVTVSDIFGLSYFATANGDLWGYDAFGTGVFQTVAWHDHVPQEMVAGEDFVLAEQYARSGGNRHLVVYYTTSGIERNRILISMDIRGMARGNDEFILAAWDGGEGLIYSFEPEELTLTKLGGWPGVEFQSILQAGPEYLLVTDDRIFRFNRMTYSLIPFAELSAQRLIFEDLNQWVITITNGEVAFLDYPTGDRIFEMEFDDPLLDFNVIYNK